MMKKSLLLGSVLFSFLVAAQANTEVYLADISTVDGKTAITNLRNISNNEGYNNQPSFYDDHTLLFSSNRNGQTDIAKFDSTSRQTSWISDTPGGSEYSPLKIPESDKISSVRLDTSGLQRLYGYEISSGKSELILKDAKVGYHVWFSKDILINTVLIDNRMDLVLSNLKDGT